VSKPRSLDLDAEIRRTSDAILGLEAKIGVGVEAARARDVFPHDTDSDVPLGSALAAAERRCEEEDGHEAVVRRIRQVYFCVADRDLRGALMRGSRDMHDLRFRASGAAVEEAAIRLRDASNAGPSAWKALVGAVVSAAWSYAAYHYAGTGPAIAPLAAGVSLTLAVTAHHVGERDRAVSRAEGELRALRSMAEEGYRLRHAFSRREAETGEPDGGRP